MLHTKINIGYLCFLVIVLSSICWGYNEYRPEYLGKNRIPIATRDLYCGAYVVWHTLSYFGNETPIGEIIDEMAIEEERGCSIAELILTFKKHGVKARGCRIDVESVQELRRPFIPYLLTNDGSGHFVLCVPQDKNYLLVFDGPRNPYLVKTEILKDKNYRMGWEGLSVLIDEFHNTPVVKQYRFKVIGKNLLISLLICALLMRLLYRKAR